MASYILKKIGEKHAAFCISLTGFIVGLPIFCDSGYIVLSGLNKSLSRRTGIPVAVMSVSLATGLYSVHCLLPPHPGASAAAGMLGVDFGRLILAGLFVAIPASVVGYIWAGYAGSAGKPDEPGPEEDQQKNSSGVSLPSALNAFLPVIAPILLISARSFIDLEKINENRWISLLHILGEPVIALSVGILLALNCVRKNKEFPLSGVLQDGAEKAGSILVIIGAGGSFGAVLAAARIGEQLGHALPLGALGIFFPFLIAFILKTAQGSSTVAIITSASIVLPILPALNLNDEKGQLLSVLSMGAGSMMISHANDAYFWVIAKFSGLDIKTMLRVYSVATLLMGLTSLLMIFILSKIL